MINKKTKGCLRLFVVIERRLSGKRGSKGRKKKNQYSSPRLWKPGCLPKCLSVGVFLFRSRWREGIALAWSLASTFILRRSLLIITTERFVEWAQNEIAVVPDFHKRILFSDEAHFWLNGYVNKQNFFIWSEANPQVYAETPLHPEKLTVWCTLWAGGILLQKR
ncbi:uncharacterized protein TNCV_1544411 [Trichonephila clavipes]|nr:uncharacterized protein TNCV_1544411 [Trichonephila clavipes]